MDLLLELGTAQLDHLRKVFLQNDGLNIEEFVQCMLELLPQTFISEDSLVKTVSLLQDAFAQVDVNGDGNMSWDEMMAALIDAGSPQYSKTLRNPFQFVERETFAANTRHSRRISRLRYIPELQMMAACEEGRRYIVLYDASSKRDTSEGYPRVCEIDSAVVGETEGGDVFDVAYMPDQNAFMLATADFSIQFWDGRPLSKHLSAPLPINMAVLIEQQRRAHEKRKASAAGRGGLGGSRSGSIRSQSTTAEDMNMFKAKERKKLPKAEAIASIHTSAGGKRGGLGGMSGAGEEGEEEDEGDVIEDDDNLGPENEKMGIKAISTAGSNSPLFITKVHSPTPIRQMCWVSPAQKLISSSSGADLMVWHVYMERSGYATWDLRVALRGVLSVHQKIVTEMVFLRDLGLLATSSMDTTVALWGIRGLPDGVGGRRGFPDSPTYKPGYIQGLPKGHASAGVFLVSHAKDVHARGVRSLLYVPSVRMLFSAGYEPFIQAWDMAIEDGTPTYRLIGHMESVVGMASLEPPDMKFEVKTDRALAGASAAANADLAILRKRQAHFAQIVSVDEGGQFRWWDCARDTSVADGDRCLQTWFPMSASMSNQKFAALGLVCTRVPPRPKAKEGSSDASTSVKEAATGPAVMQGAVIIGVGSRLKCFEAVRQDDDRAVPAIGLYHDVTSTFCAVTQQDIRWFDAQTGLMGRVYRAALPVEACSNCCTFDGRRRKLFVGCSGGSILCFNTFNCRVMKALPRHSMDVSGLVYCAEDSTIISTGWDGRLHIVDEMETEMDGERAGLMRRVKRAHGAGVPITSLAFDYKLSLIATAGGNGKIRIWDYQDLSFLGDLSGHDGEISSLTFLSPWPVLVSADVLGVVNVWRVARGMKAVCIASMAHRPSSIETPPPMKPSEEAVLYQGLALRARMAAFLGTVTRRMHARVTGTGEGQAAASRPVSAAGGGAYSAREAALQTVRTPVAMGGLASPITTGPLSPGPPVRGRRSSIRGDSYRLLSVLQTGLRDDLVQSSQEAVTSLCVLPPTDALACMLVNPAGLPVSAQDGGLQAVQKAGDTPSREYPTLLVGDEQGRLSLYDLSHVLEPISMELGPEPEGGTGGEGPAAGVDKEGLGTRLVTGSNSSAGTAQAGSTVLAPLRGRIERVPEARLPCNRGVYHPRKMVKRTGPAPLTKRKDFTREELELMEQLAQRAEGTKARSPLRTGVVSSTLSLALPSRPAGEGPTPAGQTLPAAHGRGEDEEQEDGDGDDDVSVASSEDMGDDEAADLAHDDEGEEATSPSPPASPSRLTSGMPPAAAAAAPSSLPDMPSMFEEGKQSGTTRKELPSRSIPALARCVGDAWAPVHVTYAHGLFFDAAVTDDPTAATQDKKGSARHNKRVDARGLGSGSKSGWKGFPIRSIRVVATVELVCVLTASEDGTLRAFDLRGKPLAALPVATGRRGADASSSAVAGRSVVSALAQGMEWRMSLESGLKQHILTQYAQTCLAALEGAKAKVKVVQDAKLAGRVNSIERSELRDAEKRIRRSSIVAAHDFLEPSVAKKKAKMLALRSATGDVVPGDASSMPDRARVIGQLFGAETWKKDVLDEAKEAALRTAARVEGRRGSVSAMISSTLGVSVMAMKAQVEAAKAEERDFSGPIPENSAITAPPRADADVLPSARGESSTGGRPRSHFPAPAAQSAAQMQAQMMEKLLADPSIRSLIELSTAEREEFKAGFLAGPAGRKKKKRLNVIGLSGSTTTALPPPAAGDAGKDGAVQGGGEGEGGDGEADSGDEEERIDFDLEAHLAAMTPAERKLRQIRAIGGMAATESGGRITVNGVVLQDPSKAAAAAAVSAKESKIYPSFYAEAHRPSAIELAQAAAKAKGLSTESKLSESYVSTFLAEHMEQLRLDTARKARQEQLARGAKAIAAHATKGTQSNVAPSSSSMPVGGARAAAASLSRSRQQPVTTPLRPPTATGLSRMASSGGSQEEAQEGEAVVARPLARAAEALDQALRKSDAARSRAVYPVEGSASSALASMPSGTRLGVLKSALQGMFEGGPGGGRPGSSAEARPPKARTVTEMLKERNPRLMAHLEAMREKKRRGSILVSMSDTALQVKVTEAIAQEEAAERAAKQRRKSFLAQKQAALDAAEAQYNPQVATAAGTASASSDREGVAAESSGSTGTASPKPGAAKKNAATSWAVAPEEKLTPSQFYILSRQARVGGALKRDVLAFQQLIRTADRNGDGTVGYDEFVAFIESGSSGLSHMKGHLESLFRSADKSGNGLLSVPELAAIMFPKATSAHLREIVLFVTYIGPSEPGKRSKKSAKVYSEDTLRQLRELFGMYDADGGGTIDRQEMLAAMTAITGGMHTGPGGAVNTIAAQEEAQKMMAIADASGDGEISFEEFVRLMGPAFEMDAI